MSLSKAQEDNTRKELKDNYVKAQVTMEKIALDLNTSTQYVEDLFDLNSHRIEDPWILRNYLIERVREKGEQPTEFTALKGSCHSYWFLDGKYIECGKINNG